MSKRLEREKSTVQKMIRLYCRGHHHTRDGLCPECRQLEDYALNRVSHCKFGDNKPTCGKCTVHCYKPDMRTKIKEVMRYSGPRMLFVDPVSAFRHLIDGRKKG
jgi:hypothetical protein